MAHLGEAETEARDAREDAIRQAHLEGLSMREIARVIGLSHQRVAQIVRSPRRR
jgi:DNA-directed RNA polymerase specialized sigma24 family protein